MGGGGRETWRRLCRGGARGVVQVGGSGRGGGREGGVEGGVEGERGAAGRRGWAVRLSGSRWGLAGWSSIGTRILYVKYMYGVNAFVTINRKPLYSHPPAPMEELSYFFVCGA